MPQGSTQKYSGIVKNVNKNKPQIPEEPTLSAQEIVDAFRSFGFEPNTNKMNDVGYWSTRPQSEKGKLMSDLKKKRETENKAKEESNPLKDVKPRLSDTEINALFDEYGIPAPDPEWARNNLPNDVKSIRNILKIQRKAMDDAIKAKQTQQSQAQAAPQQAHPQPSMPAGAQMPMMGMGGPGDMEPSSPFFVGDNSIVRITNPNNPNAATLWLVDSKKKTLRPFMSEQAFQNAFEDPSAAEKSVMTLSTKDLGQGGALSGFKMLNSNYGVQDDGSMKDIEFSPSQLEKKYGKPSDENAENKGLSMLDGLLDKSVNMQPGASPMGMGGPGYQDGQGGPGDLPMYNTPTNYRNTGIEQQSQDTADRFLEGASVTGEISPGFINSIKNDPERMALYVGALAYGGYTLGDVYNDIKRLEMASQGNDQAGSFILISPEKTRDQYVATNEGRNAYSIAQTFFPQGSKMLSVDPNLFQYTVYNIPDEAFSRLVPIMDVNSQEFKDAVDNVKSAYHDVLLQQLQADTDQAKAVADYNYTNLKNDIKRTYGIALSDNATDAWKQIEGIADTYNSRGLKGSGMETEAIDDALKIARKKDDRNRYDELTKEEREKASYYRSSASPDEINALTPEEKAKYGLTPSNDILNEMSVENLMRKYNLSEEDAKRYRDTVLDDNGNFRSTIYKNFQTSAAKVQDDKKTFQEQQVLNNSANEEEKAYRTYTQDPQYQFSKVSAPNSNKELSDEELHSGTTPAFPDQTYPKTDATNSKPMQTTVQPVNTPKSTGVTPTVKAAQNIANNIIPSVNTAVSKPSASTNVTSTTTPSIGYTPVPSQQPASTQPAQQSNPYSLNSLVSPFSITSPKTTAPTATPTSATSKVVTPVKPQTSTGITPTNQSTSIWDKIKSWF